MTELRSQAVEVSLRAAPLGVARSHGLAPKARAVIPTIRSEGKPRQVRGGKVDPQSGYHVRVLGPEVSELELALTQFLVLQENVKKQIKYEYQMVQVPPNISVDARKHKGNEAAAYLQGVVDTYAKDGWEFHRVDSIGVQTTAGCLAALFGKKAEFNHYHVISFRREIDD